MEKTANSIDRVCASCRTASTSQWRYGHSSNVLLCNACGIRWKRKNKTSSSTRIKPGPKRKPASRSSSPRFQIHSKISSSTTSTPSSRFRIQHVPSLSSFDVDDTNNQLLLKQSKKTHPSLSSSSTTLSSSSSQLVKKNKSPGCPKMSLDRLICNYPSDCINFSNTHKSVNKISNLLNFPQEETKATSYS